MQVILEGMGRSLHTNLNARFKCDALKVKLLITISLKVEECRFTFYVRM